MHGCISLSTAGLAAAVALTLPTPAVAEVRFRAAVSPTLLEYPNTRTLTYSLEATNAGAVEERFNVELRPAGYGDGTSPLDPTGGEAPRIVGPGDNHPVVGTADPVASECGSALPEHGNGTHFLSAVFRLPAQATATLIAPHRIVEPPWLDRGLGVTFRVTGLGNPIDVRSPGPGLRGRLGLHIRFWIRKPRVLRVGQRAAIVGRVVPPLAHQRLRIRYYRGPRVEASPDLTIPRRTLRDVRTDRLGRFRAAFRPRHSGRYEFWIRYRSRNRRVYSDYACTRSVRVHRPL